jgi:hypothetical protein
VQAREEKRGDGGQQAEAAEELSRHPEDSLKLLAD